MREFDGSVARAVRIALALSAFAAAARAQHEHHESSNADESSSRDAAHVADHDMSSMDHDMGPDVGHDMGHDMMGSMQALLGPYSAMREASGTSWVPESSPMHGLHFEGGGWDWMVHGFANVVYDDQGGPRGEEEWFGANMVMLMGSRRLGAGTWGVRAMLSLEPATVGDDGYPLLFQTGETSDGVTPLVDAQHAHDLFMELSTTFSIPVGEQSSVFAYLGLPGEPALGPPTFMHRFSGMEIPEAPISHHWLDSTHISYGVATLGATLGPFKVDASAFNGREPDEDRWNIETAPLDSASARISYNPTPEWAFQASYGDLHEPEELDPGVDVARTTVSAIYNRAWDGNVWQTTLAVGRNDPDPGQASDAYLIESAVVLSEKNTWFARAERVDEDELFSSGPLAGSTFTVDKFSLGYLRSIATIGDVDIALGGLGSIYRFDDALDASYGDDPRSFMLFLRARL